jgi:hypothetical protein
MSEGHRSDWSRHIDQVIRSKHYAWIAEGLDGEPLENALANIMTDIMHVCRREGIAWETLVARSRERFDKEEAIEASRQRRHAPPQPWDFVKLSRLFRGSRRRVLQH